MSGEQYVLTFFCYKQKSNKILFLPIFYLFIDIR